MSIDGQCEALRKAQPPSAASRCSRESGEHKWKGLPVGRPVVLAWKAEIGREEARARGGRNDGAKGGGAGGGVRQSSETETEREGERERRERQGEGERNSPTTLRCEPRPEPRRTDPSHVRRRWHSESAALTAEPRGAGIAPRYSAAASARSRGCPRPAPRTRGASPPPAPRQRPGPSDLVLPLIRARDSEAQATD